MNDAFTIADFDLQQTQALCKRLVLRRFFAYLKSAMVLCPEIHHGEVSKRITYSWFEPYNYGQPAHAYCNGLALRAARKLLPLLRINPRLVATAHVAYLSPHSFPPAGGLAVCLSPPELPGNN